MTIEEVDGSQMRIRFSATDIASALGKPPPTEEQARVIEAPLEPTVVIAGAGSGKTETMAARVVWLIANGLVPADQVLGLTFTRKAARELAGRVRQRLGQLRRVLGGAEAAIAAEPVVATYDAYAQQLVAEHALRLGHEPSTRLISEAVRWQLAAQVVEHYSGPMDDVEVAVSTVIRAVLDLHGELAGHLVTIDELARFGDEFVETVLSKPRGPRQRTRQDVYADVATVLARQRARKQLLPLVRAFADEKARREVVDFADQAALAARLAATFPEVGRRERQRFAVVLLDEYQDTSQAQLVMLQGLFGSGHPVTAVGDPCQSIYGWRGASAATLTAFSEHFPTDGGRPASIHFLTRSFRNGSRILAVANAASAALRAGGITVPELVAADATGPGRVECHLHLTVAVEAAQIAERAAAEWHAAAHGGSRVSIAVLVRKRSQIDRVATALRSAGLPVEVVGVGGLLSTPEVADVVATLRVLVDPTRGDAAMRLLTGARWQIGPRDLEALGRWARRLAAGPDQHREAEPAQIDPDDVDGASLVDALDSPPPEGWLSQEGRRRVEMLARELRWLRSRSAQPLPDLVSEIIRTLGLDIEVAARTGPSASSRADLDAFLDVVADFASSEEAASPMSLLAFLDAAEVEERGLEPGQVEVDDDRVQVLTVHGAKGLEWDVVFIPGLVEGVFPAASDRDKAWLTDLGALPFPLRGDRFALPALEVWSAADQIEIKDRVDGFVAECGMRARLEERRLAYVAFTRARQVLVCSAYHWDEAARPRRVGEFLAEIKSAAGDGPASTVTVGTWVDEPGDTNPVTAVERSHPWPYDLMGERRAEVAAGADLVQAALSGELNAPPDGDVAAQEWERDVHLLLAERAGWSGSRSEQVFLPEHLSVSQLVQLRRDPDGLARAIRRPMPMPPAPSARRGTAFHGWLEARWGTPQLLDLEELPGSADEAAAPDADLEELQAAFLRSEWAHRVPVEVESAFELTIGGVLVRGRVDAVFATPEGGLEVVDWKTGRPPRDDAEQTARSVQLAAYRLAFARLHGVPIGKVSAAFHHVREGVTWRPVDLLDEAGLAALVNSVPAADRT